MANREKIEPLEFTNACTSCSFENGAAGHTGVDRSPGEYIAVERLSEIANARLIGVVAIDENDHVSPSAIIQPGTQCWFHFDCTGNAGATFNIVTDGNKWMPVNRRSGRVTTNMRPKRSVDLKCLSLSDKELLLHAINVYVTRYF